MGLLRTLFTIVIVYYFIRFLLRLIGPFLINRLITNVREKAQKQHDRSRQQTKDSFAKEGETIIDKKPKPNHQKKNSIGEYVDFEEID